MSSACNWAGGGLFKYLRMESYEQVLTCKDTFQEKNGGIVLDPQYFSEPDEGLVETFNWLLGLRVKQIMYSPGLCLVLGEDPEKDQVLVIWRCSKEVLLDKARDLMEQKPFHKIYLNGSKEEPFLSIEETFQELLFEDLD